LKRLAKKYSSIHGDIEELKVDLSDNPFQGDGLGRNLFKVRMAIASKGKGKSGGARVITIVKVIAEVVVLAAIYDKSELSTMTDAELKELLNNI
jgi:hypothetical protein